MLMDSCYDYPKLAFDKYMEEMMMLVQGSALCSTTTNAGGISYGEASASTSINAAADGRKLMIMSGDGSDSLSSSMYSSPMLHRPSSLSHHAHNVQDCTISAYDLACLWDNSAGNDLPQLLGEQHSLSTAEQEVNAMKDVNAGLEENERSSGPHNTSSYREATYAHAALQAVDWASIVMSAASRRPKRRHVRLSSHPQSASARRRRERISLRIHVLQQLDPGGTHLDTASMLDEAIRYVKFLKAQLHHLQCLQLMSPSQELVSSSTSSSTSDEIQSSPLDVYHCIPSPMFSPYLPCK